MRFHSMLEFEEIVSEHRAPGTSANDKECPDLEYERRIVGSRLDTLDIPFCVSA